MSVDMCEPIVIDVHVCRGWVLLLLHHSQNTTTRTLIWSDPVIIQLRAISLPFCATGRTHDTLHRLFDRDGRFNVQILKHALESSPKPRP